MSDRTKYIKIFAVALFGLYSIYLFYIQVVRGSEYSSMARSFAVQSETIPAQRGQIFDRNHDKPLVSNQETFSVQIIPSAIPAALRSPLFSRLADLLKVPAASIEKKVPPKYYHLYQPIDITSSTDYSTIAFIAEHKEEFPGVSWTTHPVRVYYDVGSLSHILGYVGDITRDEYKLLYNKGYTSNAVIGKAGVEKVYDSLLKGKDGRIYQVVDVKGKGIDSKQNRVDLPEPGKDLVLTIDEKIQKVAEKALGNRMGSVIVLKPTTGEILAMVSYPWFDPNIFTQNNSGEQYLKLLDDPQKPLLNRAFQSSYPPASTFKTVLTTATLEEKAFSPDQKIVCRGEIDYGGRTWQCWIHPPGHGPLDLMGALAQSCDIYFWTLGRDYLGVDTIASYAGEFGYGKPTDIDLPGENDGFVPTPQWKLRTYNERWTPGDTMNLSIGQGFMLASPLQVADMMAMIINDGVIFKPHVVRQVLDPKTGAVIEESTPQVLYKTEISASTFQQVRADLRNVIVNGTAKVPISTRVVEIAGKTGTAEVGLKDHWHSWFVSYGPYNAKPEDQIVVVTMVEASNPWEWWGPYAANVIYQAIFANQNAETAAKAVGVNLASTVVRGKIE